MSIVLPFTFTPNTTIASAQVNANFAALQNAFNSNTRMILTAPTTFYLSPSGSDTVSGLNPSQPAATVNYILGLLSSIYDMNGQSVKIQLANGTYNQSVLMRGTLLGQYFNGQLQIVGATAGSPNLVTIAGAPCFQLNYGALVTLDNITMQSSNDCIVSAGSASVIVQDVIFGAAAAGAHMRAIHAGQIFCAGNYQINAGAENHWFAEGSGSAFYIEATHDLTQPPPLNQPTITLNGTPAFTDNFFVANELCSMNCTAQFVGSATGNRGTAILNAVMNTRGNANALTTYFPGTVNPTTATGGLIV